MRTTFGAGLGAGCAAASNAAKAIKIKVNRRKEDAIGEFSLSHVGDLNWPRRCIRGRAITLRDCDRLSAYETAGHSSRAHI
jgi:hypothetical protein